MTDRALLLRVCSLILQASDETLHLVLETLQAAIKAGTVYSESPYVIVDWSS